MRLGWEIPNPVNATNDNNEVRFPFAVITPTSPPTTYDITFTVKDDGSTPIENAKVILGSQEKKTNGSGQAVFKSLGNRTIPYVVSYEGKQDNVGSVKVETSGKTVDITLLGE